MTNHAPPYMEWYPRDVMSDPAYIALSTVAKTIYRNLLDAQWICGGVLPADDRQLLHYAMVTHEEWMEHSGAVLGPPYFERTEDGWENARVSRDMAKAVARIASKSNGGKAGSHDSKVAAGKKGAEARWGDGNSDGNSDGNRIATGMATAQLSALSSQLSEHSSVSVPSEPRSPDGAGEHRSAPRIRATDVEKIYQAYPRKVGKKRALEAIRRALRSVPADELLEAVEAFARSPAGQAGTLTPHPATWFNAGRWEDDRAEWGRQSVCGGEDHRTRGRNLAEKFERNSNGSKNGTYGHGRGDVSLRP